MARSPSRRPLLPWGQWVSPTTRDPAIKLPDSSRTLLLATSNRGKVRELGELLAGSGISLATLVDLGISLDVEETGDTYEENAAIKARAFASASGLLTLADDSGLEVDALGGAPGVRSARYSTTGSDSDNVDLLLKNLSQVSDEARTARFVCVVAIAGPSEDIEFSRGECEGAIVRERRGEGGFGYDPIFLLTGRDVTMAQLTMDDKNRISHRARAVRKAIPLIKRRLEETGP